MNHLRGLAMVERRMATLGKTQIAMVAQEHRPWIFASMCDPSSPIFIYTCALKCMKSTPWQIRCAVMLHREGRSQVLAVRPFHLSEMTPCLEIVIKKVFPSSFHDTPNLAIAVNGVSSARK